MICSACGEMIGDGEYTIINGEVYCNDCRDDLFAKCDDCGKWVNKDSITRVKNGDWVCEDCLNNYAYCQHCEEYVPEDEIKYVDWVDEYVCEECIENDFYTCCECGEILDREHLYTSNDEHYYCESCYDNIYTICCQCDCEIRREEAYTDDYGREYCQECYEERNPKVIHSYHDSNVSYNKLRTIDDSLIRTRYYGIELEVSGDSHYAEEFLDIVGGEDHVVLMKDSSIGGSDGFEIVSMPMTRAYFKEKFMPQFTRGLEFLRENGFRSHNYGGMHVHISEIESQIQLANLCKILYGDIDDRNIWLALTQRQKDNMNRWSSMDNRLYSTQQLIETDEKAPAGGTRYTAINYDTRTETHEFRIFNGNIRTERFLKNMQIVFALMDYTNGLSEVVCSTKGFLKFVNMNREDYPHLWRFIEEREIWNNTYFPDSDEEEYDAA